MTNTLDNGRMHRALEHGHFFEVMASRFRSGSDA
jgi:hypothetical protein